MNSIKLLNRRTGYFAAALTLAVAMIMPALVSAAQVTERSIALSNSSVSATGVTYEVNFTAPTAAAAMIIDFCSNSPLLGESCTAPTGFDASSAAATGFTATSTANHLKLVGSIAASTNTITVTGLTNPEDDGTMYARVTTYASTGDADAYVDPTDLGTVQDDGGIALSITPTIGVSGAVLESMTFCVSGAVISDACVTTTAPVLKLGETVGTAKALDASAVSTGSIFTQISTNAANGAVISLKSNTFDCGGLLRVGSADCDIAPAQQTGIVAGEAKFGVKTTTATGGTLGTLQPVSGSGYNNSAYALNYTTGNTAGVTSTFGDPFLDTDGSPVNGRNMELNFGASITNDTPAGLYSADISMIATGKF